MADEIITAQEFEGWLPPRQALTLVDRSFRNIGMSAGAILEHLRGGQIRAVAQSSTLGTSEASVALVLIPNRHWHHLSMGGKSDWWDTGVVRVFIPAIGRYSQSTTIRYFGIRFDPVGVQQVIADRPPPRPPQSALATAVGSSSPSSASSPLVTEHQTQEIIPASVLPSSKLERRGRPRKEFWDDLLIAVFSQIYIGSLKLKTQADIERAMLEWAEAHGYELGETSVKGPARKLFMALQD